MIHTIATVRATLESRIESDEPDEARNPMYWAIEDQSGCDMYGFRAERGAEEHLRRHLGGLPPISPYDGSLRRCGLWRKALDVSHLHR